MKTLFDSYQQSDSTEVSMKPVCGCCGYVFEDLSYDTKLKKISPFACPNCKKVISEISIPTLLCSNPSATIINFTR